MKRRSAGSVFWGITLVALGGLFLARNLGYPIPVWNAVARYWPLLIIGWGLLKLIDYFHLRKSGDSRPLFSGGEVALLILVIFTGSAITAAANIDPDIGRLFDFTDDFDLWDITGNNYSYEEHHEADIPAGSSIEVLNLYGNVEIRPSDVDRIILDVEKTIRASSREEADRRAPSLCFQSGMMVRCFAWARIRTCLSPTNQAKRPCRLRRRLFRRPSIKRKSRSTNRSKGR